MNELELMLRRLRQLRNSLSAAMQPRCLAVFVLLPLKEPKLKEMMEAWLK